MADRPIEPKNESGAVTNIAEKFDTALDMLIDLAMSAGMHTNDIADILEREAKWCRAPYQNPADNEPQT